MNQNTFNQQLEQAENLFAQGDMNNALEKFYQLNEQFPNSPEILNNLGVVQYNLNNLDQAEAFISQALDIDPDFADAKNNLSAVIASKHSNTGQNSNHCINDDNSSNPTEETFSINTRDNIQVCTPASIEYMTPFVLLEQEKWFEQETDFIRKFIQPGMNTLDIGACFGVYALLMAKLTGASGWVYAFEPGSFARKHLEKSRQDNKFDNLKIFAQGLADKPGNSGLNLNSTPELNTVHEGEGEQVEDVELTTLDSWWQEAGYPEIDLIKLDVNNKESLVLQGAKEFLSQSSPAILFSLAKTGTSNNNLLQSLRELGFSLYQYIPGPGILAEFDPEAQPEPYLLNLIAIKPDKANKLEEQGLIAPSQIDVPEPESDAWNDYLSKLPWTGTLLPAWQKQSEVQGHQDYLQALNFICAAQDPQNTKPKQLGQTQLATQKLMQLYNDEATGPVAFTLARGLRDLGLRQQAVQILERLLQEIQTGKDVNFDLPFLPPLPGFDHVPIEQSAQKWIMARCIESIIFLRSYSGYFTAQQDKELLQTLQNNPEHCIETQRRLALTNLTRNQTIAINKTSPLLQESENNCNVWFWKNVEENSQPNFKHSGIFGQPKPDLFKILNIDSPSKLLEKGLPLQAIKLDRNFAPAYHCYTDTLLENGDRKNALITLKEAKRLDDLPQEYENKLAKLEKDDSLDISQYLERSGQTPVSKSDNPMNILVITNLLPPQEMDGFGRTVWEFCQMLIKRGHTLNILTADMSHLHREPDNNIQEVEQYVSRDLKLYGDWRNGKTITDQDQQAIRQKISHNYHRIMQEAQSFQPDACLVGNLDFMGYQFLDPIMEKGIPVVHRLGNSVPGYPVKATPKSSLYCMGGVSAWVNSNLEKQGYHFVNTTVLRNGSTLESCFRHYKPTFDTLRICFAGLLMPYKGAQVLVQALAILHRQKIPFTCEFAGDTTHPPFVDHLISIAKQEGFIDRISFPGFLKKQDLTRLYARSNVMVIPSVFEDPFSRSQLEGMAAGLALVSSGTGGSKEIINHDINGLIFENKNPHDLAQKLIYLYQNPEKAKQLAAQGQNDAFNFTTFNSIKKLERLFNTLRFDQETISSKNKIEHSQNSSCYKIHTKSDITIVTPANLNVMTTYVLLEQEDWCEPEIEFVRELIVSGMTALDMDTEFGVYALNMAKQMKGQGQVIAQNANDLFLQSVRENDLQDVVITELDCSYLDFIRQGETEPDKRLLDLGNPLVMFPARKETISTIQTLGLNIYRFIPALKALVPSDSMTQVDSGNLFACNKERAEKLRERKLIA